jgi:hypothetical protein
MFTLVEKILLVIFILLVCAVFGVPIYLVEIHRAQQKEDDIKKQVWFEKHQCVPEGYVGQYPKRTYRCDDGILYVWNDIPQ